MNDKNYKVIIDSTDFRAAMEHLNASEFVAYDTETTGLNVRKDTVIGFSFSGAEGVGYYLPLYFWENMELKPFHSLGEKRAMEMLKVLLTKKLIMHNASYDCRITYSNFKVDLIPALYCDTILLKHTVDEEMPFGLKPIAKKIQKHIGLDVEKEANQEQIDMVESIKANGGSVTKGKYELYKADMYKIGVYACADVDLTLRIFNYYNKQLREERLESFFYKDEVMPLLKNVTIPMEQRGIPVDVPSLKIAKEDIIKDLNTLESEIQSAIKPMLEDFEHWFLWLKFPPKRSGSFAQVLSEYAQLDLPKTKSGRFSLTNSNLERLEPSFYKDYLLGEESTLPDDVIKDVQMCLFKEEFGDEHMFNLSSKHHLKKLFFDHLKETPISKTAKGNPQVDHLFLHSVKDKYDWVPLLLDYNKLIKLKGSYIDRFLDDQEEGIFYPRFFQHRTISGRYGSDIQQIPRPLEPGQASDVVIKHTNRMRKFFISGEDHVFVDADYESLEPHVFAHVSGDKGLKDIFLKGNDFYSTIAIDTENLDGVSADKKSEDYLGKVDKLKRQQAKAYALGIPYGMEAFKLSKTIDVRQREAEKLIAKYLAAYPNLARWMDRSNEQCIHKGQVKSEAGRTRRFKMAKAFWYNEVDRNCLFNADGTVIDPLKLWEKWNDNPKKYDSLKWKRKQLKNFLNNAKNFQIQSLAASITNRACIAIARELKRQGSKGYVCAQIHDQIVVRVPKSEAKKWQKTVQYLMENTYKISIPLKAPAEIGLDFYEAH
jgi:DNA polymerase I-like protein with 3'-5' exonuclease and polymerase domains